MRLQLERWKCSRKYIKMQPKILHIEQTRKFRYLWLKYVTGVNLDRHCARCLKGYYSDQISPRVSTRLDILLDEYQAEYFYLCGVSSPYRWENNFHLAFRYKAGSTIDVNEKGIHVKIVDAEKIDIVRRDTYDHPMGDKPEYYSCRNWQFAQQISGEFK